MLTVTAEDHRDKPEPGRSCVTCMYFQPECPIEDAPAYPFILNIEDRDEYSALAKVPEVVGACVYLRDVLVVGLLPQEGSCPHYFMLPRGLQFIDDSIQTGILEDKLHSGPVFMV